MYVIVLWGAETQPGIRKVVGMFETARHAADYAATYSLGEHSIYQLEPPEVS